MKDEYLREKIIAESKIQSLEASVSREKEISSKAIESLNSFASWLIVVVIFFLSIISWKFYDSKPKSQLELENERLKQELKFKQEIINSWEDHANRMKRIVGLPDTVEWSYKQKVIRPIDTHKLEK